MPANGYIPEKPFYTLSHEGHVFSKRLVDKTVAALIAALDTEHANHIAFRVEDLEDHDTKGCDTCNLLEALR